MKEYSKTEDSVLIENTDFEVRTLDCTDLHDPEIKHNRLGDLKYILFGILFGIILIKAEVASWFRIQEMFRFESFYMYGIMGTAILTGMISIFLIKKYKIKTIYGESIEFHKKKFNKGQIIGGLIFGFGWAITGACPGPIFAQIGAGYTVVILTFLGAVAGTWVYGYFREKLPR